MKDNLYMIKKDVRFIRHRLFSELPTYHDYKLMYICNEKKIGRHQHYQVEFSKMPGYDDGTWWFSNTNRKVPEDVPEKFYKWTSKKILVNLIKNDIIALTTYSEIAKRALRI